MENRKIPCQVIQSDLLIPDRWRSLFTFPKGHFFTIPKRSPAELPGDFVFPKNPIFPSKVVSCEDSATTPAKNRCFFHPKWLEFLGLDMSSKFMKVTSIFFLNLPSLKLTFSPLKMDGWNTILSYWGGLFSGALAVSFRVPGTCWMVLSKKMGDGFCFSYLHFGFLTHHKFANFF